MGEALNVQYENYIVSSIEIFKSENIALTLIKSLKVKRFDHFGDPSSVTYANMTNDGKIGK